MGAYEDGDARFANKNPSTFQAEGFSRRDDRIRTDDLFNVTEAL